MQWWLAVLQIIHLLLQLGVPLLCSCTVLASCMAVCPSWLESGACTGTVLAHKSWHCSCLLKALHVGTFDSQLLLCTEAHGMTPDAVYYMLVLTLLAPLIA